MTGFCVLIERLTIYDDEFSISKDDPVFFESYYLAEKYVSKQCFDFLISYVDDDEDLVYTEISKNKYNLKYVQNLLDKYLLNTDYDIKYLINEIRFRTENEIDGEKNHIES